MFAQVSLDHVGWPARVERDELELLGQRVQLVDQAALVFAIGFEKVLAQRQLHARFPVVHSFAFQHPRDQRVDANLEVQDQIGHQRESE